LGADYVSRKHEGCTKKPDSPDQAMFRIHRVESSSARLAHPSSEADGVCEQGRQRPDRRNPRRSRLSGNKRIGSQLVNQSSERSTKPFYRSGHGYVGFVLTEI
jgi:hypothetical protein